jgi:TatD DNase family protein
MNFFDIGINLMSPSFDRDREDVIARAAAAGVSPLVITGSSVKSSAAAVRYAESHAGKLYATAGVHPHNAKECGGNTLSVLREMAGHDAVVAIGECGLDYNRDFSPRDVQREWFEKQLVLGAELGMPLFLHERDASDDFCALLQKHRTGAPPRVVHCFTGGEKELDAYLELGCYIGITGWICDERRGSHLVPLVKKIPSERLLLETDAPYLVPKNSGRSGRNESANLTFIASFIADILGKDDETLAEETSANARLLFSL